MLAAGDLIFKFYSEKWNDQFAYTARYFSHTYGVSKAIARWFLMKLVYQNKLIALKVANRVYFMKPENRTRFQKYCRLKGVKFL